METTLENQTYIGMGFANLVDAFQAGREAAQMAKRELPDRATVDLVLALGPDSAHFQDFVEGVRLVSGEEKLIGILLSGANKDGALGMKHVADRGGLTIVQDPAECMIETMPKAALATTKIDHVLKVDEMVEFFKELDKQYK